MNIVPYIYSKDKWSIPYELVVVIYEKMLADKTAESVFCTGLVTNFDQFHAFIQSPNNHVVTVWDEDILFIGWLNTFNKNSASGHFSFFKKSFGEKSKVIGRKILKYWFQIPSLDTIIGTIPDDNDRALKYVLDIGANFVGNIPNYSTNIYTGEKIGVNILYFERGGPWAE